MFLKLASDNMIRLHGMKMTVSVSAHEFKCKDGFKPQRLYVCAEYLDIQHTYTVRGTCNDFRANFADDLRDCCKL